MPISAAQFQGLLLVHVQTEAQFQGLLRMFKRKNVPPFVELSTQQQGLPSIAHRTWLCHLVMLRTDVSKVG